MAIIKKFRKKVLNKKTDLKTRKCFIVLWKQANFENINFEINRGEIFKVGPNGVGKSTIFNLVTA